MAWVKLDDQFADHPKVNAAGPLASWLYVCGLTYCARQLTDGFIPAAQIRKLADVDNAGELASILVSVGLWEQVEGGYMAHDYLKYNPTAAQVKAEREATRQRVAKWRGGKSDNVTPLQTPLVTQPVTPLVTVLPSPSPIPIDNTSLPKVASATPASEGRKVAKPKEPPKERPRDEIWDTLAEEFGQPQTEGEKSRFGKAAKSLRAIGATPEQIHERCKWQRALQESGDMRWTLTLMGLVNNWTDIERQWRERANSKGKPTRQWIKPTGTDGPEYSRIKRLDE